MLSFSIDLTPLQVVLLSQEMSIYKVLFVIV